MDSKVNNLMFYTVTRLGQCKRRTKQNGFPFNCTADQSYTAGMLQLALDILKPLLLPDGDYVTIIFKKNDTILYTFTNRSAGN